MIVFLAAIVLLLTPRPAAAEIIDLEVQDGCLDSVAGGVGLFEDVVDPADGISLESPGPVVRVVVEWVGEFESEPADADLGLTVTGPSGTDSGDVAATPSGTDDAVGDPDIYSYHGDAADLFGDASAGTYDIDFTPPPNPGGGHNHWWGATVTVVYDTSPCGAASQLIWKTGADYYFGGPGGEMTTTEPIVYEFDEPLSADMTATVRMAHGGADISTDNCRVSVVWAGTGSGPPPADLVDVEGNPVSPGATEGLVYPVTPPNQPCPAHEINTPVTESSGGYVGARYALVEMDLAVPAGATWVALQLESPQDNGGFSPEPGPESGSWGGGLLVLNDSLVPDVALEKTVLAGPDGACPGVGGDDELLAGEAGTPVTYCFRVTNIGETALDPVTLDDPDLGITEADMTLVSGDDTVPLPAGGELVYSYESTIETDLLNTATVTGGPVDDEGAPFFGVDDVTDTNDTSVEMLELAVDIDPVCDNDTPYLTYDIEADGIGDEATIAFSGGDDSESAVVPVGSGRVLWPGAEVDADDNPTDWPGWDLDDGGEWFLNPDNPYTWARGDVEVTVEVNPTVGPVTVTYPPAEPACTAEPPQEELPPGEEPEDPDERGGMLPATGAPHSGLLLLALELVVAGAAMLLRRRIPWFGSSAASSSQRWR